MEIILFITTFTSLLALFLSMRQTNLRQATITELRGVLYKTQMRVNDQRKYIKELESNAVKFAKKYQDLIKLKNKIKADALDALTKKHLKQVTELESRLINAEKSHKNSRNRNVKPSKVAQFKSNRNKKVVIETKPK